MGTRMKVSDAAVHFIGVLAGIAFLSLAVSVWAWRREKSK